MIDRPNTPVPEDTIPADQAAETEPADQATEMEPADRETVEEPAEESLRGRRASKYILKRREKRREKIRRILAGNDIRYRGPVSYRWLRILGWLFYALAGAGMLLSMAYRFFPGRLQPIVPLIGETLSRLYNWSLPLFMLASFAVILNAKDGYRWQLTSYGRLFLLVYALFLIVAEHYAVGGLAVFLGDRAIARETLESLLIGFVPDGYIAFNIFVDLFLCAALVFFLIYEPKRFFRGKLRVVFRLFALIPILYECASVALKLLSGLGLIRLSIYIWPLLTTKPPILFVVFLAISLYIKRRERAFRASGLTREEFQQYQKTNRNSLRVSLFIALAFVVGAIVDFLAVLFIPAILAVISRQTGDIDSMMQRMNVVLRVGVGSGFGLLFLAPFMLLFSFSKTHKNRMIDRLIPIGGVVFVVLFVFEFAFEALRLVGIH